LVLYKRRGESWGGSTPPNPRGFATDDDDDDNGGGGYREGRGQVGGKEQRMEFKGSKKSQGKKMEKTEGEVRVVTAKNKTAVQCYSDRCVQQYGFCLFFAANR